MNRFVIDFAWFYLRFSARIFTSDACIGYWRCLPCGLKAINPFLIWLFLYCCAVIDCLFTSFSRLIWLIELEGLQMLMCILVLALFFCYDYKWMEIAYWLILFLNYTILCLWYLPCFLSLSAITLQWLSWCRSFAWVIYIPF